MTAEYFVNDIISGGPQLIYEHFLIHAGWCQPAPCNNINCSFV